MSEVKADETERLIRDKIVSLIRDNSAKGVVSSLKKLQTSASDCGDLSGFYGKISQHTDCSDIKEISGGDGLYYYSSGRMSDSYAKLAVMLEEKDLLNLIVSTIRDESRIYPRTTAAEVFIEAPYSIPQEDMNEFLKIIETDERFPDIDSCRTSIDSVYLYSTDYIPKAQAEYLSEWDAVGQYESQ
ncbi:MAG: hypothetical protein JEZ04_01480 [Spirochaetales bacterium]|nr:hypothetical protein [Spirochaetales bacterium]